MRLALSKTESREHHHHRLDGKIGKEIHLPKCLDRRDSFYSQSCHRERQRDRDRQTDREAESAVCVCYNLYAKVKKRRPRGVGVRVEGGEQRPAVCSESRGEEGGVGVEGGTKQAVGGGGVGRCHLGKRAGSVWDTPSTAFRHLLRMS